MRFMQFRAKDSYSLALSKLEKVRETLPLHMGPGKSMLGVTTFLFLEVLYSSVCCSSHRQWAST